MELKRPYYNLDCQQIDELGMHPADVGFEMEEALSSIGHHATQILNIVRNLKEQESQDMIDNSEHHGQSIESAAVIIEELVSALTQAVYEDIGHDWEATLDEARRSFDPQKEWGTY